MHEEHVKIAGDDLKGASSRNLVPHKDMIEVWRWRRRGFIADLTDFLCQEATRLTASCSRCLQRGDASVQVALCVRQLSLIRLTDLPAVARLRAAREDINRQRFTVITDSFSGQHLLSGTRLLLVVCVCCASCWQSLVRCTGRCCKRLIIGGRWECEQTRLQVSYRHQIMFLLSLNRYWR